MMIKTQLSMMVKSLLMLILQKSLQRDVLEIFVLSIIILNTQTHNVNNKMNLELKYERAV